MAGQRRFNLAWTAVALALVVACGARDQLVPGEAVAVGGRGVGGSVTDTGAQGGVPTAGAGAAAGGGKATGGAAGSPAGAGASGVPALDGGLCLDGDWCWVEPRPFGNDIIDATNGPDGALWLVTDGGFVFRVVGDVIQWVTRAPFTEVNEPRSIEVTAPDRITVASYDEVALWNGSRWKKANRERVPSPCPEDETHAWLRCYEQTARIQGKAVPMGSSSRVVAATLTPNGVAGLSVLSSAPGVVSVCDATSCLDTVPSGDWLAWTLAVDVRGRLWTADTSGTYRYEDGVWIPTPIDAEVVKLVPQGNTLWAVGKLGAILRLDVSAPEPQWTWVSRPPSLGLGSGWSDTVQWGTGPRDLWFAGAPGYLTHYTGEKITMIPLLPLQRVVSFFGSGPADVWAIIESYGSGDWIGHWDGQRFSSWAPGDPENPLRSVPIAPDKFRFLTGLAFKSGEMWLLGPRTSAMHRKNGTWEATNPQVGVHDAVALAPDSIWVKSGSGGRVSHWDGQRWTTTDLPVSRFFQRGLSAFAEDDVWALARGAQRWDGAKWQSVPPVGAFDAVAALGGNDVWLVSAEREIWKYDGTQLRNVVDVGAPLTGVWGVTPEEVWVTGPGIALRRRQLP